MNELVKTIEMAQEAFEDLMGEVVAMRDAITHPNGRRAYSIDSADQIRVDALNAVLEKADDAHEAIAALSREGTAPVELVDPFTGEKVQISNDIVDRLEGRYACGPMLPNGEPEFGWRKFDATPLNLEAAKVIRTLRSALTSISKNGEGV